ncbi:MAG: hypothetical protein IJT78_01725 [Oscillospiraceae bacterium]|nr:hypothetical protein [Oscillospiraceae bacterium]
MTERPMMDDRRAEEVWRRVAPELNPYPEARRKNEGHRPPDPPFMRPKPPEDGQGTHLTREITEPEALSHAIAAEQAQQRELRRLSRRVPAADRAALERLAAQTGHCVRRLMSVCCILNDGPCRRVAPPHPEPPRGTVVSQLGQQYRRMLRAADQYGRWAQSAGDPVLKEALEELSDVKRRHARAILHLLEDIL